LVRRRLLATRTLAQEAIAQGLVTVDGAPAFKPASQVRADQALHVAAPPRRYVSRGGEKLDHALRTFGIEVAGRHALDAGVSTGGFTDRLLQGGAVRVLAYDVGYGQVHESIRTDPRVVVAERTNVRALTPSDIPAPLPDLLVADLSFISLALVLPGLCRLLATPAEAVLLVKPQFEAERGDVGAGGIVRDPLVWRRALERVAGAGAEVGWAVQGATASPVLGSKGNVEFLLHLGAGPGVGDLAAALDAAIEEGMLRRVGAVPDGPRRTP
jgi:23S rRNA (cytidine1920-2'-O)/16S rRNA (cytidine1409-2'-O)-methyltransferase